MSRRTAHDVLKNAFEAAGLNGHLATHSLRKSFAQRLYDRTGDIFAVQEMLGHRNVATTQKYLGVNYASVRQAVEEMAVASELHITTLLGSSLKKGSRRNPIPRTRTPRIRPLESTRQPNHRRNHQGSHLTSVIPARLLNYFRSR